MKIKEDSLHPDYKYLSSVYLIHDINGILDHYAREANNLYNIGMYVMRQNFIRHGKLLSYFQLYYAIDKKKLKLEKI